MSLNDTEIVIYERKDDARGIADMRKKRKWMQEMDERAYIKDKHGYYVFV